MHPLSAVPLDRRIPLLADRLVVSMPGPSFVDPPFTRHGGLMGFERRSPRSHRAGFDLLGVKFRVAAYESFRLDDGRLAEHARAMADGDFAPGRVLELVAGRHYLVLDLPPRLVDDGKAHRVGASLVALPDGLVVELRYYLDPAALAAQGPEEAQQLVIMIARSAEPGPRRYARGPATIRLGRGATDELVELDLARDWVPTLDRGADFAAHRLLPAIPLGVESSAGLSIYLGHHPSVKRPERAKDRSVRLFGRDVDGFGYGDLVDRTPLYRIEAVAPVPGADGVACHVELTVGDSSELPVLTAMVASARSLVAPAAAPAHPSVDFDALCGAAHPQGGVGPRSAMDALWNALFDLDEWHFAVAVDQPTTPLIARIDGNSWAFAFTDAPRVLRFYRENASVVGGEHATFLSMPLDGARAWIASMGARGLFGVHFNYGQPGWFAPWANVDRIHAHLRG